MALTAIAATAVAAEIEFLPYTEVSASVFVASMSYGPASHDVFCLVYFVHVWRANPALYLTP